MEADIEKVTEDPLVHAGEPITDAESNMNSEHNGQADEVEKDGDKPENVVQKQPEKQAN